MSTELVRVSVRILDKEYFVSCSHEERSALLDAAEFLNTRMREIRDSGKVVGLDRIAVMAALNLANELLRVKAQSDQAMSAATAQVRSVRERAEAVLTHGGQLDL